jgi:hypothetical protein
MAPATSPTTGQKRGPGRPAKAAQPALKKTRISTSAPSPLSSSVQSPAVETPTADERPNKLPHKISDQRPLPTLSEPQAASLSPSDYQSIAASAVLQTSLDRSRLTWINNGVFERYWVKPESGKNARPPPPNNPELKWQKHKGPCRLRIEPHIFEVEMYVEEKPKPQPVKQYMPPQGAYGQPYRQGQPQHYGHQTQYYQNRPLPIIQQPAQHTNANGLPPISTMGQAPPPPTPSTPQAQPDKKPSPDPVISMLATRASSDPELKSLMKEVATGNATQEQLKVFQGHIDELTKVINEKKRKEEEAAAAAQATSQQQQQNDMIQYDGANDGPPPSAPTQQPPYNQYQPQQTWQQPRAPAPTPAAPTAQPVVLAFTTTGATEDRFLFPQNSILEPLSPQHLLCSFLVTRRGSQAVDSTGLDPQKEYWQPITLMVEVAYNREHLIECVKRWVKPAAEVKEYMEGVMKRCERAKESWLTLRLPMKGSGLEGDPDEVLGEVGEEVKEAALEKQREGKKHVKYVKKSKKEDAGKGVEAKDGKDGNKDGKAKEAEKVASAAPAPSNATATSEQKEATSAPAEGEKKNDEPEATEGGRPRRTVRKSLRFSDV